MAKLTSLSEVHRGGEHLATLTIECDIAAVDKALGGLDKSGVSQAQLDDVLATADRVRKARAAEADAAKKAAAPKSDK